MFSSLLVFVFPLTSCSFAIITWYIIISANTFQNIECKFISLQYFNLNHPSTLTPLQDTYVWVKFLHLHKTYKKRNLYSSLVK